MDNEIKTKIVETVTANLVLPIIKDLVLPKIQTLIPYDPKKQDSIKENIETYLTRKYEKFQIIDTLVFPNKQTLFDRLYLPLTLTTQLSDEFVDIEINSYPSELLPKYIRVLIEDTAGMGKSTISKKIFSSCVETQNGIPILIELRKINTQNSILEDIQTQLSPIGIKIEIEDILKLVQDGSFVFLFDGLDEISKKDKDFVMADLHLFIEKANNNYFLITSRSDDSLSSFGDFQKFAIRPLKMDEAFALIDKYDQYSHNKIAKPLIDKLKDSDSIEYYQYLKNPFLVSLLYKSFDFKKDIPSKKTQFYSQVYIALFESHDLSKEGYFVRDKYSNLHLDEFEKVLRYVGYYTSMENKVEYDRDYILNVINIISKKIPELNFKPSDLLKDLIECVPLFRLEGNCYKWAHKSLQDYFCAKFIFIDSNDKKTQILKSIYNEGKLGNRTNIIDLYYELDPNVASQTITTWFLEDFEKHILNYSGKLQYADNQQLKIRLSLTFRKDMAIYHSNLPTGKLFLISDFRNYLAQCNGSLTAHNPLNKIKGIFVSQASFNPYATLHNLLLKKEPQIFVKLFNSDKKVKRSIKILEDILPPNTLFHLNNDPSNILNSPEIFKDVNNIIFHDGFEETCMIDFDKATNLLQLLRKQKEETDLNDFLNLI